MKKKSGKRIPGSQEGRVGEEVVDAAPGDGEGDLADHVLTSLVFSARGGGEHADRQDRRGDAEAERQVAEVPAFDQQRAERLQQVGDRVGAGDGVEPVGLEQVERQRHRGEEEEDEEDREEALHRLARAGAQRGEEADRAEGDGDRDRERDDHQGAAEAGGEFGAGDQPDR